MVDNSSDAEDGTQGRFSEKASARLQLGLVQRNGGTLFHVKHCGEEQVLVKACLGWSWR